MTNSEISFLFVDDRQIAGYNDKYLHRNGPTDVIAFPQDYPLKETAMQAQALGDIVISVERAKEQAQSYGNTFIQEINLLIVHGILHLLGYDDRTSRDRGKMRAMERRILARIGKNL